MTRRLSGIHAAWHFWFAVGFGGESGMRKLGLGGTHPGIFGLRLVLVVKVVCGNLV
nr:DUF3265 domain-containing protein [Vibrio vulnificus]